MSGGHVTAKNALASGASGVGAAASSSGTVAIAQEAKGTAVGARASDGGRIAVGGKVTASGSGGVAAFADSGGSVTVDGELTGEHYIQVGMVYKGEDDWEPVTTLTGYRTYRDGTSTVWVKGIPLAVNVCAIGDTEFPTLDDALAAAGGTASAPTVIRLLTSIDYDKTLDIGAKHVVFQLDGFDLSVNSGPQTGLSIDGGSVGYAGSGAFLVTSGGDYVVEVIAGGKAAMTGIRIAGSGGVGAYAGSASQLVVNGDIRTTDSHSRAVGAEAAGEGAQVLVNGTIWIEGENTVGAIADSGGRVTVHVDGGEAITVTGDYGVGANPRYGGEVVVSGDIVAIGADAVGVVALGGIARVTGDVAAQGLWSVGVRSADEGDVLVSGTVTATGAEAIGIDAHVGEGTGGLVRVTGSVTVTGGEAMGVEAYSRENTSVKSLVVIDGQLNAPSYLLVDRVPRTMDSKDSAEPSGHWLYLGPNGSLVKIRNGQPVVTPEPSDPPVSPEPSDPPVTPDPSQTPDPTPDESTDPEPSESASAPSDSDELPVTGAGESQWLLGLMAATVLSGAAILFLNGQGLRRRERRGDHEA